MERRPYSKIKCHSSAKLFHRKELKELKRMVTMDLDFAEIQAKRRQVMYMED